MLKSPVNKHSFVLMLMVFFLSGCDSPKEETGLSMTIGGTGIPNTVGVKHFFDFEQSVKEKLPEIKTKMLVYGQLGSEENLVSGLRRNRVQFANLSAIIVSTLVPETALLYAPYLFDSPEEADFIYDNYLTPIFTEMLDQKGLKFFAWSEIGFHHVYSKSPVLKPDDLKGVRYRVSASLSSRYFGEAIGVDVIPMGYGEIVQSLQTDLITAGDNSIALYVKTGKEQEAPHYTLTQHSLGMSVMVARKEWWNNLTSEQQQAIESSWPDPMNARLELREEEAGNLKNAEAMGINVYRLSQSERELWKAATVGQAVRLAKEIGGRSEEVLALINQGKEDYQNRSNK
jgi:TRAP-type C4-dicarboxylate transport system substrate-binding protein|tara:strand:+ start:706 stop:1734 length:1029 start_codon:yes stop_codon:yes gene_type:complete